ncbi:MAG: hypothetical protein HKN16_07730 [Saprospiraceae bacterium]|nr:hypothetical protein [Saprospiraceae bacterium]
MNSKKFHPDFHTHLGEDEQSQMLQKSSLNNKAYKTLKDEYLRIGYILKELDLMGEDIKQELPMEFLSEMMEINENLMELQFDPDPEKLTTAKAAVNKNLIELREGVSEFLLEDPLDTNEQTLLSIRTFYLKRKYLLRMLENLDSFANPEREIDPFK